jgi:multidrug efflux pump subunit AcrB
MWIVRLALRRTYTFVVMALLIAAVSGVAVYRMSTDIFPEINVPVVTVVWQYTGMPADEIEQRIILVNERVLTTSVNDVEHIESQSLYGVGVIRIYFQPGARIEAAGWTRSTTSSTSRASRSTASASSASTSSPAPGSRRRSRR